MHRTFSVYMFLTLHCAVLRCRPLGLTADFFWWWGTLLEAAQAVRAVKLTVTVGLSARFSTGMPFSLRSGPPLKPPVFGRARGSL